MRKEAKFELPPASRGLGRSYGRRSERNAIYELQAPSNSSPKRARMKRILMSAILATLAASAAGADALPSFPMFTSYQSARQNLLRQGWLPWRLPNASTCSAQDDRCRGRPEMFHCEAGGSATCVFTWKRGNSIIEVITRGKGAGPGVTGVKCQSGCGSP
jgi:hypothetical protein